MKDLDELHHFLGMHVQRCGDGLLLSQRQYMMDILDQCQCVTTGNINFIHTYVGPLIFLWKLHVQPVL